MSAREKNIALLKECYPHLWEAYQNAPDPVEVKPFEAKNGKPVFKFKDAAFHGIYRPEDEAGRLSAEVGDEKENIMVFGLGYGHHLAGLLGRKANITVYEPSAGIFRSAIDNADMTAILDKCHIAVGNPVFDELHRGMFKNAGLYPHRPYLRFFEREWNRLSLAFAARAFVADKDPKIMVVGPIWGGSEPTYRFTLKALERMGARTVPFDASRFAASYWELDKVTPVDAHRTTLKNIYARMVGEAVIATADHERPDMILAMAQAPLDAEILSRLRKLEVPIAMWFVEDFRTMGYWEQVVPYYDYFFTIQRGYFHEKLRTFGAKNVAYLPQAADPEAHKPLELTPEEKERYGSAVSFMGAGYNNRQKFFYGLLDHDLKIWGTEWNLNSELGKRVVNQNRRLKPEEYVKIFSASTINLNLHSSSLLDGIDPIGDFVNPRVFELAACNAFSLVDNRSELGELFEIGKEVITFASLADLREKIDHYLKNPEERAKIAAAARARALIDHTFERRMESLITFIVSNEGENFPKPKKKDEEERRAARNPRNVIKAMMKEAADDPEFVEFLKKFDPESVFSVKEAARSVRSGEGKLTRVESLVLLLEEFVK